MKTSNINYIRMTDEGSRDAIPLITRNRHYSVKSRLISLYWVGCSSTIFKSTSINNHSGNGAGVDMALSYLCKLLLCTQ